MRNGVLTPGWMGAPFWGTYRPVDVPTPPLGAEWAFTLPGSGWWRVCGGIATLTTGAGGATRVFGFQVKDPDRTILRVNCGNIISTNTVCNIAYNDIPVPVAGGALQYSLPNIAIPQVMLPGGYVIGSLTSGLDASDQHSAIRLYLQEFSHGGNGMPWGRADEYQHPQHIGDHHHG